ncbi:helix-turn-helix domain-containing protein [Actinoplanes sichuanensis]|uniref:Helix-turn-helix domain-containing protein n=1 Tax=Actinoplanes sichuanensis TaxID=512349 RepID=A0ABW4AK70_9ACTN|nr:helix-turn-helix domain-containing protein [Actinoplanes sichuanensis]BEL03851.1 helix-turn-helix domain-containing protein [Actinoplanes sichuanensis]
MKDLAVRLAALDADASAAVQVIAYFDGLVEAGAGLQSIVRGAAVLAGCPARLDDTVRRVHIRVLPDGTAAAGTPDDDAWPGADAGTATLRLERSGTAGPVDAMVLERAAAAARTVLDRTRGRAPATDQPAMIELLVDPAAPADARLRAARLLGLAAGGTAYAMVFHGGEVRILNRDADPPRGRAGIGPAGPILDLPVSHDGARVAVRFTAAGTDEDPGKTIISYAELGALTMLTQVPEPGAVPDVRVLEQAAAPWLLPTLHAVTATTSLRAAATRLRLHHSTLQDRVVQAEHLLGWSLRDPDGLLRTHLALVLRRLHRNPVSR